MAQSFASLEGAEAIRFDVEQLAAVLELQVDMETQADLREHFTDREIPVPLPAIEFLGLPPERWVGLWAPAPMRVLVDWSPSELKRYDASLDYATVDESLLPHALSKHCLLYTSPSPRDS